jgi:hypothetical protein
MWVYFYVYIEFLFILFCSNVWGEDTFLSIICLTFNHVKTQLNSQIVYVCICACVCEE